jgi:isopentenyl diphosphate isomerase/L-lactate dehydrogenase-like FMN-dependent dehydrogenase
VPLIASGGITNGWKSPRPLPWVQTPLPLQELYLRDAAQSVDALRTQVEILTRQLRIAMLPAGAKDIPTLKQMPLIREAAAS